MNELLQISPEEIMKIGLNAAFGTLVAATMGLLYIEFQGKMEGKMPGQATRELLDYFSRGKKSRQDRELEARKRREKHLREMRDKLNQGKPTKKRTKFFRFRK